MYKRILLVLCFFLALMPVLPENAAAQENTIDLERIRRATVFIIQAQGDDLTMTCVGSGTIVRYDGLILTNAHHTVQSTSCPGDTLIVAISLDLDNPPVPKYRAEIVQSNSGLDLALLQITQEFDGSRIEPGSLPALPFVELADSSQISLDQTLTIVGFPGLETDSVLAAQAAVSGFIAEPSGEDRSWVKVRTEAAVPIPGTMTGGGAYSQQGQLVGIPTTAPVSAEQPGENCKLIEDTNRDGFINNTDTCIPIGSFINVLRPANFARPLLRSASLGLSIERLTAPTFRTSTQAAPEISRLFFAPSVVDGLPSTVIGRAPAGIDGLYLFFDYSNMTEDTVYEVRVTIDGVPSQAFSLPAVRWSGGESGMWYVGSQGQPYPNGLYEFRVLINGTAAASKTITVGGPASSEPAFSNITFGLLDQSGNFVGNGYVLPSGGIVNARFIYQNIEPGTPWTALWYYNGARIDEARSDNTWPADAQAQSGTMTTNLQSAGGFPSGRYRLELYIESTLSATGDFVIAGSQEGVLPRIFRDVEFYRTGSPLDLPSGDPATSYPDGANTLYATFDWEQIATGTPWTMRWFVDDEVFYDRTVPWSSPESGQDFTTRLTAPGSLPDATYRVELSVNGILLASGQASVGIGQLAIDELARAGGVQLRGQIIDADTRQGIEGATFVLIGEDFSIADFEWRREQIYAIAITDRNGFFEVDRSLQRDVPYSVLIEVSGYLPFSGDGFTITEENESPVEMLIPLIHD